MLRPLNPYDAIVAGDPAKLRECLRQINYPADQHPTAVPFSAEAQLPTENPSVSLNPSLPSSVHQVDPPVSLIEYAVQQNFLIGVDILLHETKPATRPDTAVVRKALLRAIFNSQSDVLRLFLEAALQSDDLELRQIVDLSVLDVIRYSLDFGWTMAEELQDVILRAINSPELDVNASLDVLDNKLIMFVVKRGNEVLLDCLLRRGAVVDAPTSDGATALMCAAMEESLPCCRVLLQHGADPNHRAPRFAFKSPLHAACMGCRRRGSAPGVLGELLDLLLSAGLNVSREGMWVVALVRQIDTELNIRVADASRFDASRVDAELGPDVDVTDADVSVSCNRAALKELQERLVQLHANPQSLTMMCFALIRRRLSDVGRGVSIVDLIGRLPLPASCKGVLAMDYVPRAANLMLQSV